MQFRYASRRSYQLASTLLILVLAAVPAVHILLILATTGANNPSNDYLRLMPVIDHILSGQYDQVNYFRDTLQNQVHSYAFLMILRLGIIWLTHWNIYVELYLGWALAVFKLFLLFRLLTSAFPFPPRTWLLLPLAALVFSASQISMFEYGESALQLGLVQVAILLGLLAVLRRSGQHLGAGLAALSGILASWSGGGGLAAWPLFLIGMLLAGYRRLSHYLVLLVGLCIAGWPYLIYAMLGNPERVRWHLSPERVRIAITAFGQPFANHINAGLLEHAGAYQAGLFGLGALALGLLVILLQKNKTLWPQYLPSLMLVLWGVLNIVQTTVSRWYLAPWYTTAFMIFWLGLLGLAYGQLASPKPVTPSDRLILRSGMLWAVLFLGIWLVLYLKTNLTYTDKSFYLASRSPASAACLRHYQSAPTYCEGLVFQWGVGHPTYLADLARPLEKHQLTVFSPFQEWSLQGDYVLDRVQVDEHPGVPGAAWTSGWSDQPRSWADYHHLNLYLPSPNQISWRLDLPGNLASATFETAVALDKASKPLADADGFDFQVYLKAEAQSPELVLTQSVDPQAGEWHAVSIPLSKYAGKSVTLVLTSDGRLNHEADDMVLRYPHIDLRLGKASPAEEAPPTAPSNTDISPQFKSTTAKGLLPLAENQDDWRVSGAFLDPGAPQVWSVDQQAAFETALPLDVCLKDYSHLYVRMAATKNMSPRALRILYRLEGQAEFNPAQLIWMPLLADKNPHTYLYDLKLLSLPAGARLTGLRLEADFRPNLGRPGQLEIDEAGLVQGSRSGFCTPAPSG